MEYIIKGRIHDTANDPLKGILIKAFDADPFYDDLIGSAVTQENGSFEISFSTEDYDPLHMEGEPEVFLAVSDSTRRFESLMDRQSTYNRELDSLGNVIWKGRVIDDIANIDKYDITVTLVPRDVPDKYEAVVIGSGFGGTILSLTLANKFKKQAGDVNKNSARVCILERGQWWISPQTPDSPEGRADPNRPTMREILDQNHMPYNTWAYPDNLKGVFKILGSSRPINRIKGVYDYRTLGNVHIITASGVGGGSLVYANITERPHQNVYANWPVEHDDYPRRLADFFDKAENFIGINKITTNAGLGGFKLPRASVFQAAAKAINSKYGNIVNIDSLDANLSITDVPRGLFAPDIPPTHPTSEEIKKYSKQANVCQRQGRCVLGCLPGSRHTLNRQIYSAISVGLPLDVYALCEVKNIETTDKPDYKYRVHFIDYRDSDQGKERSIYANLVILAAGSLGSTEILLNCNDLSLSKKLGNKFSTNGDILGVIDPTNEIVDATRGPITTSIAGFKDENGNFTHTIEDSGIPKMFAELFATIFDTMISTQLEQRQFGSKIGSSLRLLPRYFLGASLPSNPVGIFNRLILNNHELMSTLQGMLNGQGLPPSDILESTITKINDIIKDRKRPLASPEERVQRILMLSGIGVDEAKAQLTLKNGSLALEKDYDLSHPIFDRIIKTMEDFAEETGKNGKESLLIPLWDRTDAANRTQFVLHPLGGCPMGNDAKDGVVDSLGRVFKGESGNDVYEGLYVVDGSIFPTSIGVNPSLTICALAYRIASKIAGNDEYLP